MGKNRGKRANENDSQIYLNKHRNKNVFIDVVVYFIPHDTVHYTHSPHTHTRHNIYFMLMKTKKIKKLLDL